MATLLPNGKQAFTTGAGIPLVGGKVFTYAAGTNTPAPTWSDAAQNAVNANPIILDARGEASIFWNGTYKVVLQDALGNQIWTQDNVGGSSSVSVTTLTSLSSAGVSSSSAVVTQVGREGVFSFNAANLSQRVAADPAQAVYVAPATDPTGASGAWTRQGVGNLEAQWFGALSGQTSSLALSRALAMARDNPQTLSTPAVLGQCTAVVLKPGIYQAGSIRHSVYTASNASGTSSLILRAEQPGTVFIVVPAGEFLFTIDGRYTAIDVFGITFVGGAGYFRFTNDANNVDNFASWDKCLFYNYTVCAIGNNAADAPYAHVRNCRFSGTDSSIGFAWRGFADLGGVWNNIFDHNRYHIKIGYGLSSTFAIHHNDLIKQDGAGFKEACIWLVPNYNTDGTAVSAGLGVTIDVNKFGNENLARYETRILIAPEDAATGTDWLTRSHAKDATKGGYVNGLIIENNVIISKTIAGSSLPDGNDAPFLTSYCPSSNVRNFDVRGNKGEGGRYQWFGFFYGSADPYSAFVSQGWSFQLESTLRFQYGVVNFYAGVITDPHGVMQGDTYSRPPYFAGGDDKSFIKYDGTRSTGISAAGTATIAAGPVDEYGGSSLVQATFPSAAAIIFGGLASASFAGFKHWIEIETAQVADGSRRLREFTLEVRNVATQQVAFSRTLQTVNGTMGPWEFSMPAALNGQDSSWQWRVFAAADPSGNPTNQMILGRVFVSVGREPLRTRHLSTTGSRWNEAHIVTGGYQEWYDANNRKRRKGGVPTSDLDGDAFALMGPAQADSAATTIAALKDDFNALLAKLRTGGAIGTA